MERFTWFVFPNKLYEVVKKRKDKTTSTGTEVKENKVHIGESSHSQSTHAMQSVLNPAAASQHTPCSLLNPATASQHTLCSLAKPEAHTVQI